VTPPNGIYHFTSFDVQATPAAGNHFIVAVGGGPNMPLVILSKGDIHMSGASGFTTLLMVRGADGQSTNAVNLAVTGGKGGPGGFDGGGSGNGLPTPGDGNAGMGPVGGAGGVTAGQTLNAIWGALPLNTPANPSLTPLVGGSGGGGSAGIGVSLSVGGVNCGGNPLGYAGGGGGGGGGALLLAATGKVDLASGSRIEAQGGAGGSNGATQCALYGSGGAGGSVRIVATEFTGSGDIYLFGGTRVNGGDRAPGGLLRVESSFYTWTATPNGASGGSTISFPTAPLPINLPTLQITSVAGSPAPASPAAGLVNPDITFANAVSGPQQVQISASNVPLGTAVNVRVVPASGTPMTAVSSGLGGSVSASTATATVTLPPGAGIITASATFNVSQLAALFPNATLPMVNGEKPDRIEILAMADGTSRAYLLAASGARAEWRAASQ